MKKFVTIVMLLLLLYNTVGYLVIFQIRHNLIEKEIADYINSGNYSDEDLTLFRVPLQQYIESTSKDFNRVEGDFEYHGQFYERVKERLENDTMYIYCLKNEKELELYAQLSDHVQTHLVDSKAQKQNKPEKSFKDLIKEYLPKGKISINKVIPSVAQLEYNNHRINSILEVNISIATPPPEIA